APAGDGYLMLPAGNGPRRALPNPRGYLRRRRSRWRLIPYGSAGISAASVLQYAYGVAHLFVPAASGRSKCRGCGQPIKRGELRFGECLPNLFGEGEMTLWFHPLCAAYKRPQSVLEGLAGTTENVPDREGLERAAHGSTAHRRVPRIDGAERSPSGQATCRSC